MRENATTRTIVSMIADINNKIDEIRSCIARIEKENATQGVRIDKLEEFEKEYKDLSVKIFFAIISAVVSIAVSIISILLRK